MSSAEEDARQRRPLLTREGDESPAGHAAASVAVTVSDGHALKENLNRVQFFAPAEVYHALGTSPAGLSSAEAARRLDAFGPNVISNARRTHICIIFFSHFTHLMAILLWVAGALALAGAQPELAVAIWMVNVLNGLFSFSQEYQADRATEALKNLLPTTARVVRDGVQTEIEAEMLVPGDVIVITEGDRISADSRLVESAEVFVDGSTFTGEAMPVPKSSAAINHTDAQEERRVHYKNLIFSGTSVTSGAGKAVVLNTGMSTEFGHLAAVTINMSEELSPMQVEMSDAVKIISVIAVAIGTLIFLLSYFLVKVDLHTAFIFAIGMVVAFIPEGMLPLVTLSLARATLRMAKRGAIVKKLSAVETLGCTSVICSDKTGTITRNEVTVSMLWVGGPCLTVEGHGYAPVGRVLPDPTQPHSAHQLTLLLRGGLLCNNSKLHSGVAGKYAVLGDPTEGALIVAAKKGGLDPDSEEVVMPRLQLFAFTSERKRMTSVHRSSVDAQLWAFTKGAPTTVLDLCAAAMWGDAERPLIDADRRAVLEAKDRLASLGQRVLAVAVRRLPEAKDDGPADGAGAGAAALRVEDVERDMTLVGLVAMSDPPREGIAEAVATCHRAGVRVIMITGDDGLTAANIASRIGMSGPLGETEVPVVRGADLSAMTSEQLQQLLSEGGDVVFARVTPHEKLRIVTAFQETGAVVAVTGDGVNDAPALKKAHIGIAMGLGGTDVAKEASDIILTDNNFAAIVFAIEEGRAVYENIKKFLAYILVSNTAEAVPFVFFVATRGQFPLALTVMLVLAIDLATDMIPALALGADPPQPGTMDRPPRNIKETFFQPYLLIRALVYLGSFEALCSMFAFMFHLWTHGFDGQWLSLPSSGDTYREAVAFAFAAVVFAQVGTVWVVRSETTPMWRYNFFDNPLLWFGIAFELALLLAIIEVPGLNVVFETAPFPASPHIFILIGITVLMIVVGEVFKVWTVWIRRRRAAAAGESDADKLKKV